MNFVWFSFVDYFTTNSKSSIQTAEKITKRNFELEKTRSTYRPNIAKRQILTVLPLLTHVAPLTPLDVIAIFITINVCYVGILWRTPRNNEANAAESRGFRHAITRRPPRFMERAKKMISSFSTPILDFVNASINHPKGIKLPKQRESGM